ncbi:DUF1707 and DUF4190 domain-containing protein [Actinoplanes palleronii]|uniref:DUF1707 domain-containing protein n=1 Tax=Actinoplanes palleronii TaxID=113570 RepID=A0ABQ4B648_9ACTN|nr:DUF1707 and DUF4190 domain-containing protein [Actinoplanes palleronii]GIE66123.1 hypothetical protein Apa02nite_022310 [Actinoplanes palleronii]
MYRSPHVRVSDADREVIVAQLSAATAEGRLTIAEFSERSQQAYASRTWGELSTVVYDLPLPVQAPPPQAYYPPPAASRLPLLAMIFGIVSLIPCGVGFGLSGLTGIAAIVLGARSLRGPAYEVPNGRGMALTGILCGTLGIIGQVVIFSMIFSWS